MLLVVASVTAGVSSIGVAQQEQDDGPGETTVESGEVLWQGQFAELSAGEDNASEVWAIRRVNDGEVGGLVTEVLLDGSGSATFGTDGMEGQYVVVNDEGVPVALENGTATVGASVSEAQWEVAVQTLNASFDGVTVRNADSPEAHADLRLQSNRANYPFYLFSDNLSASQLADVFEDVEERDGRAVATRNASDDDVFDANFSGVDPGAYNVTVVTTDATARDSAGIVVAEPVDGSASLANDTVTEQRGDVARFNVTLDGAERATVQIGSRDIGYLARFTVVDEDGDGEVPVLFNTSVAGTSAAESGVSAVGEDAVTNYDLRTDPVPNRLAAATYSIRTYVGGLQTGVGSLILTEPSVDGVQVWTAPDGADVSTPSGITGAVSQSDRIAYQDLAIVQIDASGLGGYVQNVSDLNSNETGLSLSVIRQGEVNVPETEVPLDRATFVPAAQNGQYFLVFDTNGLDRNTNYTVNFTVTGENPYVSPENATSYTDNFTVVDRNVSFDEPIQVPAASDATISGSSTLAPGTELDVQVENTDAEPFFERQSVEIGEDGSWEASFDLSGVSNGTNFTVAVGDPPANATGVVVTDGGGQAAEQTTEAAEQTTAADEETTETEAEADDEEAGAVGADEETTEADDEEAGAVDADEETTEDDGLVDEETTEEDEVVADDTTTEEEEAAADDTTTEEDEVAADDTTTEEEEVAADETTTTEEGIPGFGPVTFIVAAVVALAGAALVRRRE